MNVMPLTTIKVDTTLSFEWSIPQAAATLTNLKNFITDFASTPSASIDDDDSNVNVGQFVEAAEELVDVIGAQISEPNYRFIKLSIVQINNLLTVSNFYANVMLGKYFTSNEAFKHILMETLPSAVDELQNTLDVVTSHKDELIKASTFASDINKSLIAYIINPDSEAEDVKRIRDMVNNDAKELYALQSSIDEAIEWHNQSINDMADKFSMNSSDYIKFSDIEMKVQKVPTSEAKPKAKPRRKVTPKKTDKLAPTDKED